MNSEPYRMTLKGKATCGCLVFQAWLADLVPKQTVLELHAYLSGLLTLSRCYNPLERHRSLQPMEEKVEWKVENSRLYVGQEEKLTIGIMCTTNSCAKLILEEDSYNFWCIYIRMTEF